MNKLIPTLLASASLACFASAQSNGVVFYGGYGWSGSINRLSAGSTHLMGPELAVEIPISHQSVVNESFRADVLFGGQLVHGADLDGTICRLMVSTRTTLPGSGITTFGGVGWGFAQARAGEFNSFNGFVTQLGASLPLGTKMAGLAPSLEVSGSFGRSGLSGYSVGIAVHF